MTELSAHDLKKVFNRRVIFQEISFTLRTGQTLLITGPNGSGKSTLVKIIGGVLTPTQGTVKVTWNVSRPVENVQPVVGIVSPYLQMYEEFSPRENLQFALSVRGMRSCLEDIPRLLGTLQLAGRIDDPVRTFSSGMKQRVKYAFALIHRPPILILDEPMANLDAEGVEVVHSIMEQHRRKGILVVATNTVSDIDRYDSQVRLGIRS